MSQRQRTLSLLAITMFFAAQLSTTMTLGHTLARADSIHFEDSPLIPHHRQGQGSSEAASAADDMVDAAKYLNFFTLSKPCRRIQSAIAVFTTFTPLMQTIRGSVIFKAVPNSDTIRLIFDITGLFPNTAHGCHIHQFGNLTNICDATGGHFNPNNATHGSPANILAPRHVGDIITNVTADVFGNAKLDYTLPLYGLDLSVRVPSLCGENSIIGRTLVLHALPDDGGLGNAPTSTISGNSGARIACGIIGIGNDEIPRPDWLVGK